MFSIAARFHVPICVASHTCFACVAGNRWTPYFLDSSASVISSRIASSATLALNSGEWFFLVFILDRHFHHAIHLKRWPEFLRPPLWEAANQSWDEYAVCRICAGFGVDPSENYESVFLKILEESGANVREAIFAYRHNSDLDALVIEGQRNVGNLLKYASYLMGNSDGFERKFPADHPNVAEALEGHWFEPFFHRLWEVMRSLWDRYGRWESLAEFEPIAAIWLEAMTDRGLEISPQEDGSMYVNVPFRPETDQLQTFLWGLRRQVGKLT